jgi:hypothetical protein
MYRRFKVVASFSIVKEKAKQAKLFRAKLIKRVLFLGFLIVEEIHIN